ncbi:MAG: hypothetical protein ACHQHP_04415 [Bacteroidia bacterium]
MKQIVLPNKSSPDVSIFSGKRTSEIIWSVRSLGSGIRPFSGSIQAMIEELMGSKCLNPRTDPGFVDLRIYSPFFSPLTDPELPQAGDTHLASLQHNVSDKDARWALPAERNWPMDIFHVGALLKERRSLWYGKPIVALNPVCVFGGKLFLIYFKPFESNRNGDAKTFPSVNLMELQEFPVVSDKVFIPVVSTSLSIG